VKNTGKKTVRTEDGVGRGKVKDFPGQQAIDERRPSEMAKAKDHKLKTPDIKSQENSQVPNLNSQK
jgi:hypothetical protein